MRSALDSGVVAGYPIVDVKVALVDGSYHDVDSSEMGVSRGRIDGLEGGRQEGQARGFWSRSWTWRW